jgi:hypothetical protein
MPDVGDRIVEGAITIGALIVTVAIFAVLVGQHSQTSQVIQAAGGAYSSALGTALSPVGGGSSGGMGGYGMG